MFKNEELNELYEKILQKLKLDARPQIKLTDVEIKDLSLLFQQLINAKDEENLLKVLCILSNCQSKASFLLFTEGLLDLLEDDSYRKKKDILIFSLAALEKHTILIHQRNGDKLPSRLIKVLRSLLINSHPEVLEWCLRIIENLGGQGLSLKEDIKKINLGLLYFTNAHLKSSKKIIAGLLKKWSSFS